MKYWLPCVATIRDLPKSGLKAATLFSGCGGTDLGLEMAGFETIWANEFVKEAAETYAANFPGVPIDGRDIRMVDASDVPIAPGELDLLAGSPPCASFSETARREKGLEKGWGQEKAYGRGGHRQRTDDLFPEFIRILRELRPKAFMAENVEGLTRGKSKGFFVEFLRGMREAGYRVAASVIDGQWLGLPQVRERVAFVGFRDDLGLVPVFPKPLDRRWTVAEALDHPSCPGEIEPETAIEKYAIGREAKRLVPGRRSDKFMNLRILLADQPARTVLASSGHPGAAGPLHPNGLRKPTIAELKRLCGFPEDFVLTGTYEQKWERLGRSFPPPMAFAVAREIGNALASRGSR